MKKVIDDMIYWCGRSCLVIFYLLYFIFSWLLAFIVIPLMITYWFILTLFGRKPGPLSNMIRIVHKRDGT